ncbi:MBL fold metallo-hydrolase [Clostridium oryzae]|uniref:Putative metallo-hydrolase YycJ n=1 Tax=Clostridium oryzae TaxID=1450648 RepID=A0A1V4IQK5_9CLOT|nr:MBL fold metallo-hydrolase [Clostridium oryzae]OPJ62292.1 putative metallo-hydrolase YycJ [Clostridium oryzae]
MKFCSLYSGSSGNSSFVSTEKARILIDAGLPGKKIEEALKSINEKPEEIDAIFVTHEHSDHIKGIGVISRKYDVPIYANNRTWQAMAKAIGNIKDKNIKVMENNYVSIKDMYIESYSTPHDAADSCGYAVSFGNKKICTATDLGYFTDEVKKNIMDADLILLESNHDIEMLKFGPYPYVLKRRILSDVGHLSNAACGEAIAEITTEKQKKIVLGHLSHTNNYPELAYATVKNILIEKGIDIGKDVILSMADRHKPSSYFEL